MRSTPPIALTEAAISRLRRLSVSAKGGEAAALSLALTGGGGGLDQRLPVSAKGGGQGEGARGGYEKTAAGPERWRGG